MPVQRWVSHTAWIGINELGGNANGGNLPLDWKCMQTAVTNKGTIHILATSKSQIDHHMPPSGQKVSLAIENISTPVL